MTPREQSSAITVELLRSVLDYRQETGVFLWRVPTARRNKAGALAGGLRGRYWMVCLLSESHLAHRLAWLYVHGHWPNFVIDHINGDSFDNRIANLRDITQAQNIQAQSKPRKSKSGIRGVTWIEERRRWRAEIKANYKWRFLGYYHTVEAAQAARAAAEAIYFA